MTLIISGFAYHLTFLTLIYLSLAIVDPNSILVRHKKFLKQLERQKNIERDEAY